MPRVQKIDKEYIHMISDDDIQVAVDWLQNNAIESAKRVAERKYLEEYRKSLKALIMKEHIDKPVTVQEREAYADQRYLMHLKALQIAIFRDEEMKFLRSAKEAKINAWQTQSANMRTKL